MEHPITVSCCVSDPMMMPMTDADDVFNIETNEHIPDGDRLALSTTGRQDASRSAVSAVKYKYKYCL